MPSAKKPYSSQEKNCLFCENDWLKKRHLTSNWIRHIPRPFYDQLYCSKGAGEKTQNFFWQSIENNLDVVIQFKRYRSLAQKVPERLLTKRYFRRVNYFVVFFLINETFYKMKVVFWCRSRDSHWWSTDLGGCYPPRPKFKPNPMFSL